MRPRKHVLPVATIFLTLSFTLPVHAAEPAAAPLGADTRTVTELAGRGGPIAVEGQLTGRNGKPTSGTIEAFAWPVETLESHVPDGATVDRIAVAAAQVGANGKFQLRLDSASLPPGYLSGAGQVDLELVAWNADGQTQSFTSVRSHIANGTSLWVSPTAPEDVSASQAAAHSARASLALTEARMSAPSTSEALTTTEASTSAAGGVAPQLGIPVCPPSVLVSSHNARASRPVDEPQLHADELDGRRLLAVHHARSRNFGPEHRRIQAERNLIDDLGDQSSIGRPAAVTVGITRR